MVLCEHFVCDANERIDLSNKSDYNCWVIQVYKNNKTLANK